MAFEKRLTEAEKFETFCLWYFPDICTHAFSEMHREWFNGIFDNQNIVLVAPRGHAKSQIVCVMLPVYFALRHPGVSIAIVTASEELYKKWSRAIRDQLEGNTALRQDFGDQVTAEFSQNLIVLRNHSRIQLYGAESKYRGERPDILIVDDVQHDQAVRNAKLREEIKDKLLTVWYSSIKPFKTSKFILSGTVMHPKCLMSEMVSVRIANTNQTWFQKVYAAEVQGESGLVPIWPEYWTMEALNARRELFGDLRYSQEYLNIAIPDCLMPFKDEEIVRYENRPDVLEVVTVIDPATWGSDDLDKTAIVTVGTDAKGISYVLEVTQGNWKPDRVAEEIFRHVDLWKPHTVGIETVAYQKTLKWYVEGEARKSHRRLPIMDLKSGNTLDAKRMRILALQPFIKLGEIRVHKSQTELITQLTEYPGDHDDLVDALAYFLEIKRKASEASSKSYPKGTTGYLKQRHERRLRETRRQNWHQ